MAIRTGVVSHAAVLAANQSLYAALSEAIDVTIFAPRTWRDELRPRAYRGEVDPRLRGAVVPLRTIGRGRPQRHVSVARLRRLLATHALQCLIIEEEPFSLAGARWSRAARAGHTPYAVQVAENLRRPLPAVVAREAARVLRGASFVLARSPAALDRAREWGFSGHDAVVPHAVAMGDEPGPRPVGVVGFVGRLTDAKGVGDLVRALADAPELTLRVAGDGPRRDAFGVLGSRAELVGTLAPAAMGAFYDSLTVLAVPSTTTPTWSEQFGRVVVEAQARGVPVVCYDSGELPWVAVQTAATVVREGDVDGLRAALMALGTDAARADAEGRRGRTGVAAHFSEPVVATQLSALIAAAVR